MLAVGLGLSPVPGLAQPNETFPACPRARRVIWLQQYSPEGAKSVTEHTRRDFLKLSGAAASAWAATGIRAAARDNSGSPAGPVSVWTTDDAHQLEQTTPIKWQPASGPAPEGAVVLDPEKK